MSDVELGHLEPRYEKRQRWVQDQWTGEMVEVEANAAVFDLGSALVELTGSSTVKSGQTVTFTHTLSV